MSYSLNVLCTSELTINVFETELKQERNQRKCDVWKQGNLNQELALTTSSTLE